ncbi:MAG: DUF3761 domain-containing protein [Dokdonella sp.]|uniref:DUF3761 domain-containing protein n=1 Tax=Dokdonella sp. TaxID=2291710 RepID=UPI003264F651
MNSRNILQLVACAAVLALAATAAPVSAAEGKGCALRAAGPQNAANATIGHLNADGKCVAKAPPKTKESDGLEASAQCRDLSFSYNPRRESACAKHGGVMEWLVAQQ